ncbi:MAG: glycosyltransferase, partial [Thermoleophilia bacterium]
VQPAAAVLIRSFVAPGPIVRSPRWPHAIAIGAFILVRRDAYERVGGHRAIRDRLVDDRSLAELLKRHGTPLPVVDGTGHLRVRMYGSGGEVWRGWRKNASVGASDSSPWLALAAAGAGLVVALAPLWCVLRGPHRLGALAALLQLGARLDVVGVAPTPRRYWTTLPLGCAFLSAVTVASTLDRLRGGVTWRGRRYRV